MKNAPPEATPQQDEKHEGMHDMLSQIETLEAEETGRNLDLLHRPGPF